MKLFGIALTRRPAAPPVAPAAKSETVSLDALLQRLEAAFETGSGVAVTPETAMQSPTVHAIVTAISRRIATLPVHVLRKAEKDGRTRKERVADHPVERLLARPNDWQSPTSYWLDAASSLVRYGNFYAWKGSGRTGPIRMLIPLASAHVAARQEDDLSVVYEATLKGGVRRVFDPHEVHHVRGPARDYVTGNSPVMDVREAIALEIAAERFGASFFGNGAMPLLPFKYAQNFQGFRTEEDRAKFVETFQSAYGQGRRFRSMLLPKGIEMADPVKIENDKAQFLETRKYQRTVIAGAFGVPPHLVGDLERGTFNNVEQQSLDFVQSVILPYVRIFEAAMERDLLTREDRAGGIIIRFNMDGALRGDFKSRQEGLKIQREAGVISPNDWREHEGMNPISPEDGGDDYWRRGPSGQSADAPGASPAPAPEDEDDAD